MVPMPGVILRQGIFSCVYSLAYLDGFVKKRLSKRWFYINNSLSQKSKIFYQLPHNEGAKDSNESTFITITS